MPLLTRDEFEIGSRDHRELVEPDLSQAWNISQRTLVQEGSRYCSRVSQPALSHDGCLLGRQALKSGYVSASLKIDADEISTCLAWLPTTIFCILA